MSLRIYLAGPDVFLPDAKAVGLRKAAICREHGMTGIFPLDNEVGEAASPAATGHAIYRANLKLMEQADVILANLTPFRGPSADVGTAFELGWFAARGRPCFGYSSEVRPFAERTRAALGIAARAHVDPRGHAIEHFDLPDNLMLPGAVEASGGAWIARAEPPEGDPLAAFAAFEAAVSLVAARVSSAGAELR